MKRLVLLATIVGIGLILITTGLIAQQPGERGPGGASAAQGGSGQARGGGGQAGIGKIQKVADRLYMIPGAGGNTAVFLTANGVVIVDTKLANNGQAILDQVKSVSDKPITTIINTHTHGDHTGSNQFFPASVEIVTQENTKTNMLKMDVFKDVANKNGLPDKIFKDNMSMFGGPDKIELYYFGAAHTNGDAFVVFPALRAMHAGDVFATKGQPLIDIANGGSGIAYPETIKKAVAKIKNIDTVITGHTTTGPLRWQDFVDYGEFNALFLEHARKSLAAGKTAEQAMADLKLPDKFKDYNLQGGRGGPGGNFNVIYQELQKPKK
jgi:glyoxylase-like metal-dependent hydrolase (beta-lactamase superfamily II)